MNADDAIIRFGKYDGEPLSSVPVSYLFWAISFRCMGTVELSDKRTVSMYEAAHSEIERREGVAVRRRLGNRACTAEDPIREIAEVLVSCLTEWKSIDCPSVDSAVLRIRTSLGDGLDRFMELARKTFENRFSPIRAEIYCRVFLREIERPLASLVLSAHVKT